ncbi:MAG: THUMP domain-containing protein [Thermoplasmata archaeon]
MSGLGLFLLRYGEIGTKSSNIRKHFEDILIQNMENTFLKKQEELITGKKGMGRIFAYTDPENSYLFSRTFGLVSYSPTERLATDLDKMKERGREFARDIYGSFAIRARRTGVHDFSSQDVEAEVGEAVLQEYPNLEVDLDDPENELHIEVRHSDTYVFTETKDAPGGLPVGSQGKVAAYVKDERDFLAAWLIMRRGARLYVIGENPELVERLREWDVSLKEMGLKSSDDLSSIDYPDKVQALVLGEGFKDRSELDVDLMVLRPLVGFNEKRIEEFLSKIERLEKKRS